MMTGAMCATAEMLYLYPCTHCCFVVVAAGELVMSSNTIPATAGSIVATVFAGTHWMAMSTGVPVEGGDKERYDACSSGNVVIVSISSLLFVVVAAGRLAISCNTISAAAGAAAVAATLSAGKHWKVGTSGAAVAGVNDDRYAACDGDNVVLMSMSPLLFVDDVVGKLAVPLNGGNVDRYDACNGGNVVSVPMYSLLFVVVAAGKLAISCNSLPVEADAVVVGGS